MKHKAPQFIDFGCQPSPPSQLVSRLLAEIRAVLEVYSDAAVLEAASRTFLSLCGEETTWGSMARPVRDSMVQGWVDHLKDLLTNSFVVSFQQGQSSNCKDFCHVGRARTLMNCQIRR